jgi:hypothetical protein
MTVRYPGKGIASYATRKVASKLVFDDKDAIPASGGLDESDNNGFLDDRVWN